MNGGAGTHADTTGRIDHPDVAERRPNQARSRACNRKAAASHIPNCGVHDGQRSIGALIGNACAAGAEIAVDQAVLDVDETPCPRTKDTDTGKAGVKSLEVEVAEVHRPADVGSRERIECDVDAVRCGVEDRSEHLVTVNGDRLRDGHGAEAARVNAIDLTVHRCLRNRASEGLARRRTAARIGVIADT